MYEIESMIDIEQPEHHANDPESEPVMLDAIPTLKFNQEAFSAIEDTQLSSFSQFQLMHNLFLICSLTSYYYRKREVLRIMPKCLRKQFTCPVCHLPLKNSSEAKHIRPVTFTMSQPLDESHKNRPLSILLLIPMLVQRVGGCNTRTDF
ncbi:hypothetical protein HN51_054621 [Arachis hypogaea]